MKTQIIHYCCGSYEINDFGGVARYDHQIKLAFPDRKFFKGPEMKKEMLSYLEKCDKPIVITDNHLSLDIPNKYPLILVHHGSALTHAERDPHWDKYWKNLCCDGQKKMLDFRDPKKTKIVSISQFCIDEFNKFFPKTYPIFNNYKILHSSELDENIYKKKFNKIPVILGNWGQINKGRNIVSKLANTIKFIKFQQLNIRINKGNIEKFNREKQQIYCNSDVFLQLSKCEGYSYAALDAVLCGIPLISTNVGFCYKDMPEDCFVKLDWKRLDDTSYLIKKIIYAFKNKNILAKKAREWYLENCRLKDWKLNMQNLVNEFYNEQYNI